MFIAGQVSAEVKSGTKIVRRSRCKSLTSYIIATYHPWLELGVAVQLVDKASQKIEVVDSSSSSSSVVAVNDGGSRVFFNVTKEANQAKVNINSTYPDIFTKKKKKKKKKKNYYYLLRTPHLIRSPHKSKFKCCTHRGS